MGLRAIAACGAVGFAGLPSGALACPDGPEAARSGVVVSYDDSSVTTYVRNADGFVTETTRFADPEVEGYGVVALHGLYMVEEYDLLRGVPDSSGAERQRFESGLKALPVPAPGLSWTGVAQVAFGADPEIAREVGLSIGAAGRIAYGGCGYESWPVVLRHRDETEDYLLGMDFGAPAESYTPTGIAPATQ
jgi:hypothetical protein